MPWVNGRTEAWNVFPLSEQPTRRRTGNSTREAMQQPPPYDVLAPGVAGRGDALGPRPTGSGRQHAGEAFPHGSAAPARSVELGHP